MSWADDFSFVTSFPPFKLLCTHRSNLAKKYSNLHVLMKRYPFLMTVTLRRRAWHRKVGTCEKCHIFGEWRHSCFQIQASRVSQRSFQSCYLSLAFISQLCQKLSRGSTLCFGPMEEWCGTLFQTLQNPKFHIVYIWWRLACRKEDEVPFGKTTALK